MKPAIFILLLMTAQVCFAQDPRLPLISAEDATSTKPSTSPTSSGSDYRIGSDDQLDITVFEIQDLAAQPRVSGSGMISLNMVGSIQASGLTPEELERAIEKALKDKELVNEPHVTVSVREYASQPVSVMGAVREPGIYQIRGQKTLFGMVSMANGLDLTTAGRTIQVIRAPMQGSSERQVITIDIEEFQQGNVSLDVPIYANDMINVQTAGSVYVIGEVLQPGEIILRNGRNISILQAMSKSGGPTREAKKNDAIIIRIHEDETREEIPVDLDKITQFKAQDTEMMPNDILVVPPNRVKAAFNRALESTIGVVTGRLIYRF